MEAQSPNPIVVSNPDISSHPRLNDASRAEGETGSSLNGNEKYEHDESSMNKKCSLNWKWLCFFTGFLLVGGLVALVVLIALVGVSLGSTSAGWKDEDSRNVPSPSQISTSHDQSSQTERILMELYDNIESDTNTFLDIDDIFVRTGFGSQIIKPPDYNTPNGASSFVPMTLSFSESELFADKDCEIVFDRQNQAKIEDLPIDRKVLVCKKENKKFVVKTVRSKFITGAEVFKEVYIQIAARKALETFSQNDRVGVPAISPFVYTTRKENSQEPTYVIVMEYVGKNLNELAQAKPETIFDAKQLLSATKHMNEHGFGHMDLKQENLTYNENKYYFIDFGTAIIGESRLFPSINWQSLYGTLTHSYLLYKPNENYKFWVIDQHAMEVSMFMLCSGLTLNYYIKEYNRTSFHPFYILHGQEFFRDKCNGPGKLETRKTMFGTESKVEYSLPNAKAGEYDFIGVPKFSLRRVDGKLQMKKMDRFSWFRRWQK